MTKAELIEYIAKKTDVSKKKAGEFISVFWEAITKHLQQQDRIAFLGYGTFSVKKRNARTGRNPRTGEPLKIAARHVPHFSAGSQLKEAVNHPKKKVTKKS